MARDPGSVWAPLPEAGSPDGMAKDKFIVHSTGDNGTAGATRRYFELAGTVTESTFIIGWGPERNDPTLQIMDSTDIADANVGANKSGISVEVVGDGKSGYTRWQRSEIIRLGSWAHQTHDVPLQVCPTPTGAGYGWHVMFGAPGPWAAVAKSCPGGPRIKELQADIFPAIFSGTTRLSEEDDMTPAQETKLDRILEALLEGGGSTGRNNFVWLRNELKPGIEDAVDALVGNMPDGQNNFHWAVGQILTAVATMDPTKPVDAASIAALIPQGIAEQVADELVARLARPVR